MYNRHKIGGYNTAADAREFWAQNDRELAQERAASARLRQRLGAVKAHQLETMKRNIDQDAADEREIAHLKTRGLGESSKQVQVIRLRMHARHNGVPNV